MSPLTRSQSSISLHSQQPPLARGQSDGSIASSVTPPSPPSSTMATPLDDFIQDRRIIRAQLLVHLDDLPNIPQSQFATYYADVQDLMGQLAPIHKDILKLAPVAEADQHMKEYSDIKRHSLQLLSHFQPPSSAAQSSTHSSTVTSNYSSTSVRLPDIELPTFHGDQSLWPSFSARFTSIINRFTNLSDEDKLDYLQSAVKGEAKALIANVVPGSGTAFTEAWDILKQIYHNHRHTVDTIIRKLLEHPPAHDDSALRKFVDSFRAAMSSLSIMKLDPEQADYIWNTLILSKCNSSLRGTFEQLQRDDKIPPTATLLTFVQKHLQAQAHSRTQPTAPIPEYKTKPAIFEQKRAPPTVKKPRLCPECQHEHPLYRCVIFNKASLQDRQTIVRRHKLCANCLTPGHSPRDCTRSKCRTCDKPHHTLIHFPSTTGDTAKVNVAASSNPVLLQTALIHVMGRNKATVPMRAVLDGGATCSIITNDALQRLGIPTRPLESYVAALGEREQRFCKGADIRVASWDGTYEARVPVFAIPKITGNIPGAQVQRNWPHLSGLKLADPQFNIPARIDVLLGADFIPNVLEGDIIKYKGAPSAQKTKLGWVLQGPSPPDAAVHAKETQHRALLTTSTAGPELTRFWELEDVPTYPIQTIEEQKVEQIFRETTKVVQNGRFSVKLPLKNNPPDLGDSRPAAVARLLSLERKMAKDHHYAGLYKKTIGDYLATGHMQPATSPSTTTNYLPHHGVLNHKGKLRIVFDASAKTMNGKSLNDQLLNGPKTQQDLFSILTRFRTYPVAVTADIAQMYRQVQVHPEDYSLQRVLWRDKPSDAIQDLELTVVTWGTKPAAYLATRCLQEIAERADEYMPNAASKIKNDFYVDDLLSGERTVEDARTLCHQISQLLGNTGMNLHKWASNMPAVAPEQNDSETVIAADDTTALGIKWNHKADVFSLQMAPPLIHPKTTKRTVLSDLGRVFDPLGWAAPALIKPKCFVQHLWKTSSAWDVALPLDVAKQWNELMNDLQHLAKVKIPRLVMTPGSKDIMLCGFADASENAYSAVVYIRQSFSNRTHSVKMVAARTKVAPLKQVSLPRLELCGALLLARLIKAIQDALPYQFKIVTFTDSTITLHWVRGHPSRWKTFVGHRVQEIQGIIDPQCWRHVISQENPADLATREFSAADLVTSKLWWNGPHWLAMDQWPPQPHLETTSVPEEKQLKTVLLTTSAPLPLLTKCSSLSKLIRVLAYVRRALTPKNKRTQGPITGLETMNARVALIKMLQRQHYERELFLLQAGKPVLKSSALAKLTPYVDGEGLLRVGGRLQNAAIDEGAKHPIILPYAHATKLIIRQYHHVHEHAGPQLLASIVSYAYYVPALRNITRYVTRTCVTCARLRAKLEEQLMAQLPKARVTPTRPFNQCGVDFAGPFSLRTQLARGTRHYKAYVCLFVCMSTRAIHLELVTSLSAEAFLAAFARLCARRSTPARMYSDRGTNFTSASKILKDLQKSDRVTGYMAQNEVEWTFNPASAPHWGGIWEAGVRSFKFHLAAITKNQVLTYEEFYTVTCRVEAVLNSRPLTPVSTDPQDLEPLSPGHFLVGAPLTAPPERIEEEKVLPSQRWRLVQKIVQSFWQRWSSEYISRLNQRPKWCRPKRPIGIGDLVIVKDENAPPLKWRLGRIIEVHPGDDGLPRAVTVKTQFGVCSRPVVKIARLPLDTETGDPDESPPNPPTPVNSAVPQPLPPERISEDLISGDRPMQGATDCQVATTTRPTKNRRSKHPPPKSA